MVSLMDENLLRDFLADSREHLSAIEPDLLSMEKEGAAVGREAVNRVFRAVHSLKGFSVFLGFENFTRLSHCMENVLMKIRDGLLEPGPEVVDPLLEGMDKLRTMVGDIQDSDNVPIQGLVEKLGLLIEAEPSEAGRSSEQTACEGKPRDEAILVGRGEVCIDAACGLDEKAVRFALGRDELQQALDEDRTLFALWVNTQRDLADQGMGLGDFLQKASATAEILAAQDESQAQGRFVRCLLATIIEEPEIAAVAFGLPEGQLEPISREKAAQCLANGQERQAAEGSVTVSGPHGEDPVDLCFDPLALKRATEAYPNLYAVWLPRPGDSEQARNAVSALESVGEVIAHDLGGSSHGLHCLVASIISEPDTAALAFDAPEGAVTALAPESLEPKVKQPAPARPVETPPGPDAALDDDGQAEPETQAGPAAAASMAAPDKKATVKAPETIRVGVKLVDNLINLAGELVLGRNQLKRITEQPDEAGSAVGKIVQTLDLVTSDLQEQIMQLRMQPVANLFNKFPRVVRDLCRQLEKDVELDIQGGQVEMDKSILERLSDPLTHIIRNSMDHGFEPPEERKRAGKPLTGRISLRAFHEEGMVNITIEDDGRGIDPDAVVAGAVRSGVISPDEARRLSPAEKLELITLPGLSTAKEVTDLSGRGVGMDVVRSNIEKISGRLLIDSQPGKGAAIRLRLPLTLAIIPSLVIGAAGHVFAIPQVDVRELVCVQAREVSSRIAVLGDAPVLRLRGRLLPLIRLADVLGLEGSYTDPRLDRSMPERRKNIADRRSPDLRGESPRYQGESRRETAGDRRARRTGDLNIVVVKAGQHLYGLIVERLFDTEEIVVKPLSDHIKDSPCFGGTTIMGDGRVAMILDAAGMAAAAGLRFSEAAAEEARLQRARGRARASKGQRREKVVVFNYAPDQFFAAQLRTVSRLELIDPALVEMVGGAECVHYRGAGLPLLFLDRLLPVSPMAPGLRDLYMLVPQGEPPEAGIAASRIVDIYEADVKIKPYRGPHSGISGLAVLRGHLTLFLDLPALAAVSRNRGKGLL